MRDTVGRLLDTFARRAAIADAGPLPHFTVAAALITLLIVLLGLEPRYGVLAAVMVVHVVVTLVVLDFIMRMLSSGDREGEATH
ncbi:hypothetical protein JDY09_06560 [Thermoleophilum album]|uniref:hypothetical protein n=1 Tax=Thermoleophilum album TaxID=29539 RepID=UPI000CB1DF97|nr:hypothetical protein [Thermoleophilum album]MCL6441113.1 hypothetical protein [Thermoleophilum sp.]WDT93048.1 hypothetical protein JDY09_06560 [Thermoleophilum album]GBD46455.1 hypothetical protein HRbin41_01282 [bacterium HR41]